MRDRPIDRAPSFDLIVIGSGMAGSVVAGRCAEAGLRVLVLEKGDHPRWQGRKKGMLARVLSTYDDGAGERWPTAVLVRKQEGQRYRESKAAVGIGPGGSARLYGAALGRAARIDFERDFQPPQWPEPYLDGAALTNAWPVAYDEFLPAYREAERLLAPVGTRDPLDPDDDALLGAPPRISPAHEALVARLADNGRHPFRMHVGIAYKPGCSECQGNTCPRDCKAHGFNRVLEPAMAKAAPVTLETTATVHAIERGADRRWTVRGENAAGEPVAFQACKVVLAAGALNTPRLLEASAAIWDGAVPPLVGRGLMFHTNDMFAVENPEGLLFHGPRKVLAFRDHYLDGDLPLAECQSLGMVASPALIAVHLYRAVQQRGLGLGVFGKLAMRPIGQIGYRIYEGSEMFAAPLQDLPYADNRVTTVLDAEGHERIAITYQPRKELVARVKRLRQLVSEAFAPLKVRFPTAIGQPNYGHPMGTCRMGSAPDHSVVDARGQVWDQPGLYVADASVFPSSLGINPALTVAAHAIRVAEALVAGAGARGQRAPLDTSARQDTSPAGSAAASAAAL